MQYDTEHILEYLGGQMNATAKQAFETALAADIDLQERVSACRESMEYYRQQENDAAGIAALAEMTAGWNKKYFGQEAAIPQHTRVPRRQRLWIPRNIMALAAALALLVFAGLHWFRSSDLLDTYGHIPAVSTTERGGTSDQDWTMLTEAVNAHEYTRAQPLARKVLMADSTSVRAQEYYGLCLLHAGAYQESRYWLQKVYEGESLLKYRAALLIGLGYYKENNKKEGSSWLEKIPETAEEYSQARQLLRETR